MNNGGICLASTLVLFLILLTYGVKNENVHSYSPCATVYLPAYGLIPTEMKFCFSYLLYDQTAA